MLHSCFRTRRRKIVVYCLGIHGQYWYIDPPSDTVIAKLSDHGAHQAEALTLAAFRRFVAALLAASAYQW